jgi:dihydropteroate synthase
MRSLTEYGDVVADIAAFLRRRAGEIEAAGHPHDGIVLDPGFGFAKTPEQNLVLLNRFEELTALGYPVLAGTSRKSFLGAILDVPENERVEGTAVTVGWAVAKGARIVRVHDVGPIAKAVKVAEAIARERIED